MSTLFSIGTLSKAAGCKVETIRYYEKIGLMPKSANRDTRGNAGSLRCSAITRNAVVTTDVFFGLPHMGEALFCPVSTINLERRFPVEDSPGQTDGQKRGKS